MKLKWVTLFLDRATFSRREASDLEFRARYLCHFVQRSLRAQKAEADGFNQLQVWCSSGRAGACRLESPNLAVVPMHFDLKAFKALGARQRHERLTALLGAAFQKCARFQSTPLALAKAALAEFRRGGFRNEWVHQEKLLRGTGLRASLRCSLDPQRFELKLSVERGGERVFERSILRTEPDELCFQYRFKEVVLVGRSVVVRDQRRKPLVSVPLAKLMTQARPS